MGMGTGGWMYVQSRYGTTTMPALSSLPPLRRTFGPFLRVSPDDATIALWLFVVAAIWFIALFILWRPRPRMQWPPAPPAPSDAFRPARSRFAFAVISSFYLVVAVRWEERSLAREFPVRYAEYARRVKWRLAPYIY